MRDNNDFIYIDEERDKVITRAIHWISAIIIAVMLSLVIRGFIFEPVKVEGSSMENTLKSSDKLIVYKTGYLFNPPKRKDIIILKYKEGFVGNFALIKKIPFISRILPENAEIDLVKRVIGLPGDEVNIIDNSVYINGEKLDEPYAVGYTNSYGMEFPVTVPEGKLFVLGDNRENSSDSRNETVGFIDYSKIKGKALLRIWPYERLGFIDNE